MPFQTPQTAIKPAGAATTRAIILLIAFFSVGPAAAQQKTAFPSFGISSGTPLFSQATATGVVVGQGGNCAVALPDGRALWFLNNVMTGERKADGQAAVWDIVDGAAAFSASTAPWAQGGALEYVSDENNLPLALLSGDLGEYSQVRKFWPRSGFCYGGKCYVFYSIMNNYGPGPYDHFRVGQGLAWADKPAGPYRKALSGTRYGFWNDIEPAFGSALLKDEDGWLYVYGRVMTAPGEYGAALARVRPEQVLSRDNYSYYSADPSSTPWTADLTEASAVLERMPEDFSVSYNDFLKSYLAVYMDEESGLVLARQARYPWGPWAEPVRLLACAREDYCYGAREQAAFSAQGGKKIYVTVERKNAPYVYEIKFK
ncbi:MAG TPA: hypothetical protein DCS63_04060 [Elusimicrobia bacterium]|nr:hypothetical protein [Elusimicrobiota bacterium]